MSEQRTSPGWFPDPMGRFDYRYHNGVQWTADVSSGGRRFVDQTWLGGWTPAQAPGFAPRTGRGFGIASFVIGLVSAVVAWIPIVFALAAIGAVLALVFGIIALRRAARSDGEGRGYAIAGIVLSCVAALLCVVGFQLTRAVFDEVGKFFEPGPHRVEVTKCAEEGGLVSLEGRITNLSDTARGYTLDIDYLSSGRNVGSDSITVPTVPAGGTATFEASEFVSSGGGDVACVVTDVFGPTPFVDD